VRLGLSDFWFWAQFLRKSVKYRDTQLALNPFTGAEFQNEEAFVSLSRSQSQKQSYATLLGQVSSIRHPGKVDSYGWPTKKSLQGLPEAAESFWCWGRQCRLPLPNNCYVSAIIQCLFNNPKVTNFDQLTVGHPSHCYIACCMSGKLNSWAVLYAALVMLSHTYRSNVQTCNLSAAIVPSEWCSARCHPISSNPISSNKRCKCPISSKTIFVTTWQTKTITT